MDSHSGAEEERNSTRKRIPKACGACRQSKVKCDGKRPCTRCEALKKTCIFAIRPKDPNEERIERLERELNDLRSRSNGDTATTSSTSIIPLLDNPVFSDRAAATHDSFSQPSASRIDPLMYTSPQSAHTGLSGQDSEPARKKRKPTLEISQEHVLDFVSQGLITLEQAKSFCDTFFTFCDRFVPVFDPMHDGFYSIRARSGILFNAICVVGCRILLEADSILLHQLRFELKKWLNVIIVSRSEHNLETVQALLVHACYSEERSLLLSLATRMALDLELPEAFGELTHRLVKLNVRGDVRMPELAENICLMRKSRTWFGLLVLEHILRMDAGKLPGFTSKSGARRCRILLRPELSTPLDLRLLSQVELNFLRAKIHDGLDPKLGLDDTDVLSQAQDAKIDIDVWFEDWSRIVQSYPNVGNEEKYLLRALEVQKYWSETMAYFKALRLVGTENVSAMSSTGRDLLSMAKEALKNHLDILVTDPKYYLSTFRYAMDFVWAKCAFCFLLLLKVTRLLPETEQENYTLVAQGNKLLAELTKAGSSTGSTTSKLCLQVLTLSLDKYNRALLENHQTNNAQADTSNGGGNPPAIAPSFFWEEPPPQHDAQAELQSFVPEQFLYEWSFPGLTLFSTPVTWQELFDDFFCGIENEVDVNGGHA